MVQVGGTPAGGGVSLSQVPPCQTWPGGTPASWYPTSGTPVRPGHGVPLPGGYPTSGTPIRPGWGGTPARGVPHLGHPPIRPGQGGGVTLAGGGVGGGTPPQVTDGVLDTPRSVCLLRSRRRTFLCHYYFCLVVHGSECVKQACWMYIFDICIFIYSIRSIAEPRIPWTFTEPCLHHCCVCEHLIIEVPELIVHCRFNHWFGVACNITL